jgi:hypothetical protein
MTREERDLRGVGIQGSDHLTVYNLYAEAVNRFGAVGEVYGLARHVFEEGIAAWGEERGVLIKAIEDAAMGMAAVYRSLELGLPRGLPYVSRELKGRFIELLARVMPFDLVIDEHTADGQDVRVAKTSLAGSWGAVAGSLRFFADRFGVPRASIEGTTIPYELVRKHAKRSQPTVAVGGPRKHQGLIVSHTLQYFGFELDTVEEPLTGKIPADILPLAINALVDGLMEGAVTHPDHGKIRRAARELDEYWRRSGGSAEGASPERVRVAIAGQLEGITSWADFEARRLELDPADHVDLETRVRLDRLPATVHLLGDATAIEYAIERGEGVARLRLREGQARRLSDDEVPALDRPIRFLVVRGGEAPIEAESLARLVALLRNPSPRNHPHRHRKQKGRIPKPPNRRRR